VSTGYRITQRSMSAGVLNNLQANLQRMASLQEKLSSGREISRPSDSPTGTVSALRLRADLRRMEQMERNAQDGLGWLGTADTALTQSLGVVGRVRELVLLGANGAIGPVERAALAAEVETLRESALSLANTTFVGRPVFSGTAGGDLAYDRVSGAYRGDAGAVVRSVAPDTEVRVNLTGPEVFGPAGRDLFALLDRIATSLRHEPGQLTTGPDSDLAALDRISQGIQSSLATIGSRYAQVETMRDRIAGTMLERRSALAEVESIDLPATIVEMQLQEVAYSAALGATAKVIQPTLLDFLR
jgi:flagellar hook-associated protein 3 FlgL